MRTLLIVSLLSLSACTTWKPLPPSGIGAPGEERPGTVRITTIEGQQITVREPYVDRDTLRGRVAGEPVGYALQEVTIAEAKTTHEVRTAGAVYLGVGAALLVAVFVQTALAAGDALSF